MGCENTSEERDLTLEEQMRAANLGNLLDQVRFEHGLEREIFMAINMVRYAPYKFVPIVTKVKQENRDAMAVNGTLQLKKFLLHQTRLSEVRWDEQAALACRQHNENISCEEKEIYGGQIEIYKKNLGMEVEAEEFTQKNFAQNNGEDFVALQLILDWGRKDDQAFKSPIMDPKLNACGISQVESAYFQNITNILYVKGRKQADAARLVSSQMAVQPVFSAKVIAEDTTEKLEQGESLGLLKLHLKHTHLIHIAGPPLVRTQPKVRIIMQNHQWESRWQENGDENLEWFDSVMEYEIRNVDTQARIEVINHKLPEDEPIGKCDVRIGKFCTLDKQEHEHELFFREQSGGRIRFVAEWLPKENNADVDQELVIDAEGEQQDNLEQEIVVEEEANLLKDEAEEEDN